MEKLAGAIDASSNSRWDLSTRSTFLPFERQVRNTLSALDYAIVLDYDEPAMFDIKARNPLISDESKLELLLTEKVTEYRAVDVAAHSYIDKLIMWKKAPARLAEMAAIEKKLGRSSGRALWKFVLKCRDCGSYQDQQRLKKELAALRVSFGCTELELRDTLNEVLPC